MKKCFWFIGRWIKKYLWLIVTGILFIIALGYLAPFPTLEIPLSFAREASLSSIAEEASLSSIEFQGKIADSLSDVLSLPLIFQKYDIIFENTANKNCDTLVVIQLKEGTKFYSMAKNYFNTPYDASSSIDDYELNAGDRVLVESFNKNDQIIYAGGMTLFGFRTNNHQFDEVCLPEDVTSIPVVLKVYAKPNFRDWIIDMLKLLFASIVLMASLRTICKKRT